MMQNPNNLILPKPPKPPEKPWFPYMRFSRRVWDKVKSDNPDAKLWEIGKIIGQMWRDLDEETRLEIINEYKIEKERYIEQLKIYKRSPEYQQYLVEKNKVLANTSTPAMCEPEIDVASLRNVNNEVRNFTKTWYSIEPFEDQNDEDDPLSIRSIALHRYERNNVYINEIFDESNVASLLRKQNRNIKYINDKLNIQKTNIENDIENEKSKFAERQSRAQERSLKFSENLNKFLQFKITVEDEQKMFENEFLFLQKKWEEHRQRQQLNSSSIQPTQQPPTSSFQQQMTQSDKYFQPQQQQSVVPTSNLPACPQQNKLLLIQDQAKQPAFDYVRQQQQQLHQAIMTSHNNTNEGQLQPQQLMRQGYRQICPPNYNPRQATMNFHSQMHQHYRIPASDVLTVDTAQQQQHQQQYNFIQTSNSHNFYQQPVATQRPISASAAMYSTHSQPSGAHHSHQINPYCYIPISQQHRTSQHQQPNSQQHVYQVNPYNINSNIAVASSTSQSQSSMAASINEPSSMSSYDDCDVQMADSNDNSPLNDRT